MEEKINFAEYFDIIENKGKIWVLNDKFKKDNLEFYELMKNA